MPSRARMNPARSRSRSGTNPPCSSRRSSKAASRVSSRQNLARRGMPETEREAYEALVKDA